jgi:hypothetical protein
MSESILELATTIGNGMCKIFPITFHGLAKVWYHKLKHDHLRFSQSLHEVHLLFQHNHSCQKEHHWAIFHCITRWWKHKGIFLEIQRENAKYEGFAWTHCKLKPWFIESTTVFYKKSYTQSLTKISLASNTQCKIR